MQVVRIDDMPLKITGGVLKIIRVRDEPYVCIPDPVEFLNRLRQAGTGADLFTFTQEMADLTPHFDFHRESECLSVLPVSTYEHWLKHQINFKTRNKARKAAKSGVELKLVEFNDAFVQGVVDIYNESRVRQGKPFMHYGKDFDTIKRELSTFFECSEFIGAYHQKELIGFIKFVKGKNVASLMHIISKFAHRDKAPTNALLARAVELCEQRKIGYMHYGVWSRRGLGTFKISHGFVPHHVPRYYVPLTLKGRLFLKLHLHHKLRHYIPETWIDRMVALRSRWTEWKFGPALAEGEASKPRSVG